MPQASPYGAYERTRVETADQRQLIMMLYDGSIHFMRKATTRIESNDIEAAHNYLVRAREVLAELLATLKPEKAGEVGYNLQRLYVYVFNRLVEANLTKDKTIVAECIKLMTTLREGWAQIGPSRSQQQAGDTATGSRRVNVRT
ncbi:MAG TPA: flagellar export chaperone FliS [bacterium]|nr:flagellar export chaperone FliS [bacterium]